jgi:TRAP-type uncharacterized transport system substrate-binding protein
MKGFKEMVPALKEGDIDGFLMMATPFHPTWTEAAISRPLKLLSIEDVQKPAIAHSGIGGKSEAGRSPVS